MGQINRMYIIYSSTVNGYRVVVSVCLDKSCLGNLCTPYLSRDIHIIYSVCIL